MSQRKKDNTKITKFFIKQSKLTNTNDSIVEDPEYEKLKQEITDLRTRIVELSDEKRKLQSSLLPNVIKMKDVTFSYVPIEQNNNWGVFTKKKQLKFHELSGMVTSKIDGDRLIVNFNAYSGDKVHKYAIMLNVTDKGEYRFEKAVIPPSIKIKELLRKYPLDNVQRFLSIIATNCQVFHDIDDQIRNFKQSNIEEYNIEVVHSFDNRYILLRLPLIYLSTKEIFDVHVHLEYGLLVPRPKKLILSAAGMPEKYLTTLKKQFNNLKKYELSNGFEISVREGLQDKKSTFDWLKTGNISKIIMESSTLTYKNTPTTDLSREIKIEKRSTLIEKPDKKQIETDTTNNYSIIMNETDTESELVHAHRSIVVTRQTRKKIKTSTLQTSTDNLQLENNSKHNIKKSNQNKTRNQKKSPMKIMEISKKNESLQQKDNVSLVRKRIQADSKIEGDDDTETVILKRNRKPRNVQSSTNPPSRNKPKSKTQIESLTKSKSRRKVTRK